MFRYILVKYAVRGLVKNGKVEPLFHQLYLTLVATMCLFSHTTIIVSNFYKQDPLTLNLCLQLDFSNISFKVLVVGRALFFCTAISSWVLFYFAKKYVDKRSTGALPPKIFGNYQRNFFTFCQTIVIYTIFGSLSTIYRITMYVLCKNNVEMCNRNMFLYYHLFVTCFYMIIVIYLHCKVSYIDARARFHEKQFYCNAPDPVPRRDSQILIDVRRLYSTYSSNQNVIYVKDYVKPN